MGAGCLERDWGWGFWDPIFIKHPNDWEVRKVVRLPSWPDSKKLCRIDGMPQCTETKNGIFLYSLPFSIKVMYKVLETRRSIDFPRKIFEEFAFNRRYASLHGSNMGRNHVPFINYNKGDLLLLIGAFDAKKMRQQDIIFSTVQ